MKDDQLTAWLLFGHTGSHLADVEVVSRTVSGSVHRGTYGDVSRRAQQLMHGLERLGIEPGEPVATLAWNSQHHLEAYFAVPCSGRVLHTLNLRLSADDLAYVIGHAGDAAILVDADLVPLLEPLRDRMPSVRHVVVFGGEVPPSSIPGLIAGDDLLADQPEHYAQPAIDERSVLGLCYTSGTTGRPKGVAYTHRSSFLHALAVTSGAAMSIGPGDCVLPVVPMFHAGAWGMPYASTAAGAKQVYYAGGVDGSALVALMAAERVTVAAGVPTVWLSAADAIAERGGLPDLRHIVCGGSQPPEALIERYLRDFGVPVVQAWGMTETSPLASMAWPQEHMREWEPKRVLATARNKAGLPLPGIDVALRDETGAPVPFDGETMGDLYVRGPWVVSEYFKGEGAECFTDDGWLRTGDVAIGFPDGYFVIADRTKDLIKSGGEWISSVDMEAAIMAIPQVVEAAVIAIADPKWQERPLPCVVLRPEADLSLDELRAHLLASDFAAWQLPERMELIEAVPKTSVGKFDKKVLRQRFAT